MNQQIKFDQYDVTIDGVIKKRKIIGDANQVSNIMYSIWNAYEVNRNI